MIGPTQERTSPNSFAALLSSTRQVLGIDTDYAKLVVIQPWLRSTKPVVP